MSAGEKNNNPDKGSEKQKRTDSIKETEVGYSSEVSKDIIDDIKSIPKDNAGLIVLKGPSIGEKFFIRTKKTNIGRNIDSDIFLDDVTVSRNHAYIENEGEGYFLNDVGSLNGSYINGELVDKKVLKNNDKIQIGKYVFLFFHIK